jgi:hypothetical protein
VVGVFPYSATYGGVEIVASCALWTVRYTRLVTTRHDGHLSATLPVTNLVTKGGAPVAFVTLAAASALYLARGGRPASK